MIESGRLILEYLQKISTPLLDKAMIFFTSLGNYGFIWIALIILLLVFPRHRRLAVLMSIALMINLLGTNIILKPLVGRMRPFIAHEVPIIVKAPRGASFPSGHTTSSFTIAFIAMRERLSIANYRIYLFIFILASLIAFSRLYLYLHYPSDVIIGILLSVGYVYLSYILYAKLKLLLKIDD